MDAILTAGGIPLPEDPLYPATRGHPKAMVDIAGKAMVQWVLDALTESRMVDNVIVVGLTEKSDLHCGKKMYYVPNQGKLVDNLQAGAAKVLEINKHAGQVLLVSSDIPAITGEMVDWVVTNAMKSDEDIYYHVVQRDVMDKRYPGSKRTFTRLKDVEVCGGDLNVARLTFLTSDDTNIWEKITNMRKSPFKQAALFGLDTFFLLLTGQLTLQNAETKITTRLGITGHAVICPFAEVGMDVDKPNQLEMIRADFKKQLKSAEKKAGPSPKGRSTSARAAVTKSRTAKKPAAQKRTARKGKNTPARKTSKK